MIRRNSQSVIAETSIERVNEWRKRSLECSPEEGSAKKPRYSWFYRLESESSQTASADDTESVYSIQGKETDVVCDTPDTDTKSENSEDSRLEVEVEYEIDSLCSDDGNPFEDKSSSCSDNMMSAAGAIAAAICNSSLEAFVTDGEDSDSSLDEAELGRTDYWICVQCKSQNNNPLFRYCDKCFQRCWQCRRRKTFSCFPLCNACYKVRKNFFPPRPRGRKGRSNKATSISKPHVKLDNLKSCLSGLSSLDSGIGSSQELRALDLDLGKIIVPEHLSANLDKKVEDASTNLDSYSPPGISTCEDERNKECSENTTQGSSTKLLEVQESIKEEDCRKRKRKRSSEDSENTTPEGSCTKLLVVQESIKEEDEYEDCRKRKQSSEDSEESSKNKESSENTTPEGSTKLLEIQDSIKEEDYENCRKRKRSSEDSDDTSKSTKLQKVYSAEEKSALRSSLPEYKELCILCNSNPKDSIFLHGRIAHMCCCYRCAVRTWYMSKKCPICNCKVKNVVKVFTI